MGHIYCIEHESGKRYVGQTTRGVQARWVDHWRVAVNSTQDGCLYLHRALAKHGPDAFSVTELEEVSDEMLTEREAHWIEELGTMAPNGYNTAPAGSGGNLGEAANRKRSKSMTERTLPWQVDEIWEHEDGRKFEGTAAELAREHLPEKKGVGASLRSLAWNHRYPQTLHGWRCMTPHPVSGLPMHDHKVRYGPDDERIERPRPPRQERPRPKKVKNPVGRGSNPIKQYKGVRGTRFAYFHPEHGEVYMTASQMAREYGGVNSGYSNIARESLSNSWSYRGWVCVEEVNGVPMHEWKEGHFVGNGPKTDDTKYNWVHEDGREIWADQRMMTREFGLQSSNLKKVIEGHGYRCGGWHLKGTVPKGMIKWYHPEHGEVVAKASEVSKRFGACQSKLSAVKSGKRKSHKGWSLP